jgi:prephenate dehydratase
MQVNCLGPAGSYSHQLAIEISASTIGGAEICCHDSFIDTLFALNNERDQYALLPLENSTTGFVRPTLEALFDFRKQLRIHSTHELIVNHSLLSWNRQTFDLRQITRIYSHPEAILQCRHWLQLNCPGAQLVPCKSSGEAAELVSKSNPDDYFACIGSSQLCLRHTELQIYRENIQDHPDNRTRFILVSTMTVESKVNANSLICYKIGSNENLTSVISVLLSRSRILNITTIPVANEPWAKYYWFELAEIDASAGCVHIIDYKDKFS